MNFFKSTFYINKDPIINEIFIKKHKVKHLGFNKNEGNWKYEYNQLNYEASYKKYTGYTQNKYAFLPKCEYYSNSGYQVIDTSIERIKNNSSGLKIILTFKRPDKIIGVDLGKIAFIVTSDNQRILKPPLEEIDNIYDNQKFLHSVAEILVMGSDCIIFENLKDSEDCCFFTERNLISIVKAKARKENKKVYILKSNFYESSKTCSNCCFIHEKLDKSERYWTCPSCGSFHERDFNAAINIRNKGIEENNLFLEY